MNEIIEKLEHGLMVCIATNTTLVHIDKTDTKKVLELLKEQKPIEPEEIINDKYPVGDSNRCRGWRCGECKEEIPGDANFCPYCGRKVKWDG